jgi:S-formylglutathione hydrolase FrmB
MTAPESQSGIQGKGGRCRDQGGKVRWSYISNQFAALLRWIKVSCQADNLIGSVLLA